MAVNRKLQWKIDKMLKNVQESVDVFDNILNKVEVTDNANQKEKFDADLKKEIYKLKRYREQITTWILSSEIKRVSPFYETSLMDAGMQIDWEIERFKIYEKEIEMKDFLNEGLGQQPKADPKEKAKSETMDWMNSVVGELKTQIDVFEAEIKRFSVTKGKTRPHRLVHLETSSSRHKALIKKLELLLRLVGNDELSSEQVNDVKDFLDDYVERNQAAVSVSMVEKESIEMPRARELDLSPGKPFQPVQTCENHGGTNVADQLYNLQMLEAAYHKLPQPRDSERDTSAASYPHVQAPFVKNPAFWQRLGKKPDGASSLFFAFYYLQNTYQQYLAAKELKKQSWRYHKRYNRWFQRHEVPEVITDEYEQGCYTYFDFYRWRQMIRSDFMFEYKYLENELN